jgi:hypothetical protein
LDRQRAESSRPNGWADCSVFITADQRNQPPLTARGRLDFPVPAQTHPCRYWRFSSPDSSGHPISCHFLGWPFAFDSLLDPLSSAPFTADVFFDHTASWSLIRDTRSGGICPVASDLKSQRHRFRKKSCHSVQTAS